MQIESFHQGTMECSKRYCKNTILLRDMFLDCLLDGNHVVHQGITHMPEVVVFLVMLVAWFLLGSGGQLRRQFLEKTLLDKILGGRNEAEIEYDIDQLVPDKNHQSTL